MPSSCPREPPQGGAVPDALPDDVLAEVAAGGAADAGGLRVELLGDFLGRARAAVDRRRTDLGPAAAHVPRARATGGPRRASPCGHCSTCTCRPPGGCGGTCRRSPTRPSDPQAVVVAGEVMLHAVDDVVAALAEGYQLARRVARAGAGVGPPRVRRRPAQRRGATSSALLQRASGFGLDLSGPHAVATVRAERPFDDGEPVLAHAGAGGPRAARATRTRCSPARTAGSSWSSPHRTAPRSTRSSTRLRPCSTQGARRPALDGLAARRRTGGGRRRRRASRPTARRSTRSSWPTGSGCPTPVVDARDLLVYQVLLRDRAALLDLVEDTLAPLRAARGGAEPLLDTLAAYFDCRRQRRARRARALHLSVRAVTYRLRPGRDADRARPEPAPRTGSPCTWPCSARGCSAGPQPCRDRRLMLPESGNRPATGRHPPPRLPSGMTLDGTHTVRLEESHERSVLGLGRVRRGRRGHAGRRPARAPRCARDRVQGSRLVERGLGRPVAGLRASSSPSTLGSDAGVEFTTAWLLEKSLSVDNLFVFALIFGYFKVPREYQHRVLFFGVIGALVFRGILLAAGVADRQHGSPRCCSCSPPSCSTARTSCSRTRTTPYDPGQSLAIRLLRKVIPVRDEYAGTKFFVREARQARRHAAARRGRRDRGGRPGLRRRQRAGGARRQRRRVHRLLVATRSRYWACGRCTSCSPGCSNASTTCRKGLAVILAFIGVKLDPAGQPQGDQHRRSRRSRRWSASA